MIGWLTHHRTGHCRYRHARADAPHPRRRRAASVCCAMRRTAISTLMRYCPRRRLAGPDRHGPGHRGHLPMQLMTGMREAGSPQARTGDRRRLPCGRHGFRRQAEYFALPDRRRLRCDGGAGRYQRRRDAGKKPGRYVPVQRPGRPGSNGPPMRCRTIASLIDAGMPIFGICLGHQLMALALGARRTRWIAAIAAPTIQSRI